MRNVNLPPKLENYMPETYDGVVETDAILDSENQLFGMMAQQFNNLFDNQYVLTATEWGIARYEKMLNIIVDPITEDLAFRRERVLNRLTMNPPYTTPFLRSKLDEILGVGGYQLLLPTGDRPQSLIANDFSDFTAYMGATVTKNKTFPIDVFKGGRNYLLNSGEKVDFEEQGIVPTTVGEYLPTDGGRNLILNSGVTKQFTEQVPKPQINSDFDLEQVLTLKYYFKIQLGDLM